MAHKWQILFAILIIACILGSCQAEEDESPPAEVPLFEEPMYDEPVLIGNAKVAAYIRTWGIPAADRIGGSPYWNADMIQGESLSDLIIAFALIDPADGASIYIPEVRSGAFARIWDEVAILKERHPHLKVHISVGGYGAEGFSDMAHNPALRAAFTANVCKWLEDYNLDGIDIDWEYPVGPTWGQNIKSRPEDRQNYITLLSDLRNAMDDLGEKTGKRYNLSTAVPASAWFISANDVKAAAETADMLKIMSYDYYGSWSQRTGHNANIYRNPRDPANWSTDQSVAAYLRAGIPPEKLILGAAFYGQMWRGIPQGNSSDTPGLYQSRTAFVNSIGWSQIKRTIANTGSGYERYWDATAKAPFLYNGDRWLSYTDHEQLRELAAYVKEKNLGGVFVWEYAHDMGADLLRTLTQSSQ